MTGVVVSNFLANIALNLARYSCYFPECIKFKAVGQPEMSNENQWKQSWDVTSNMKVTCNMFCFVFWVYCTMLGYIRKYILNS